MGAFTFEWTWIVQDIIIYLLAILVVIFIIKKEHKPIPILLEFVCFVFLYAAVYENFATLMGWYGYGRSILMVFNVPLSVPVIEYLVVYAGIRLAKKMNLKVWMIPIFVGFLGTLLDFSLDPLSVSQIHVTLENTIGRWTWYPASGNVAIFDIPIYNFTGWFLLCGYATVVILQGRFWQSRAKRPLLIGYLYPPIALLVGLLIMISPLSNFLLWLGPFLAKGSFAEYIMLGLAFTAFLSVLIYFFTRRRSTEKFSFKEEWPLWVVFAVSHVSDILFTLIGGYWSILPLVLGASVFHMFILFMLFRFRAKKKPNASI